MASRKIRVQATVEIPKVPNFLRMSDGSTISVSDIEESGLEEVGKAWTHELIARAREISAHRAANTNLSRGEPAAGET